MSWAAENVEAYEEMCIRGIVSKIDPSPDPEDELGMTFAIVRIAEDCPKAFSELCAWAHAEISEEEADYHSKD